MKAYLDLLWQANQALNLISRKMTYAELIDNHVVDCLLPLKHFPAEKVKAVADFGTGGGLPGVLYALNYPDKNFHLYEKSPKKREFLTECQRLFPNINIHAEIPTGKFSADLVVARAFKPIETILDLSRHYYLAGGKYFLLKGRNDKIQEELTLAKKKFPKLEASVVALSSPVLNVERHLVLI
jgi:16S rRNA (guanine527-N7)-methyltransferase